MYDLRKTEVKRVWPTEQVQRRSFLMALIETQSECRDNGSGQCLQMADRVPVGAALPKACWAGGHEAEAQQEAQFIYSAALLHPVRIVKS